MAEIRDQALALLSDVKLLQKENAEDAQADGLKRMMELVMELVLEQKDASLLLPECVPCLLEFRNDPRSAVRENVAEMIEGICVQNIGYMEIIAPTLLALLQDSEPSVVQRAISSGSNIFQTVFDKVALQGVESRGVEEDLVECWNWMIRFKEAVYSIAFRPGNDDAQLLALKFVEATILLFTPIHEKPLPALQTEENHIGGHPVLDANALEREAYKNLELLLNQLQDPEAPSLSRVVAFAIINSLTRISERRPYMSATILPVFSGLLPDSESVPGSRNENILQELKSSCQNSLAPNQPGALQSHEQLIASLRTLNVDDKREHISSEPETPTPMPTTSAVDTSVAPPSINLEEIEDSIVKEPGTPTSVSSASMSCVSSTKDSRPAISSRTALKSRNTSDTATVVTSPPRSAAPIRQIKTSSPASTVTAPPRAASPARPMRTSVAAALVTAPPRTASPARQPRKSPASPSVTAPPRTASPARQTRTSPATPIVTAPPRNASPARQTRTSPAVPSLSTTPRTASPARQSRVSLVTTSDKAPPRAASPARQPRTSSATVSGTSLPRTASPSRQPRTSSTPTTGTVPLRSASASTKLTKVSGSIPQNGTAGKNALRGSSPARTRSGSVDSVVSGVSSHCAGPSDDDSKPSHVSVPSPPTSVKSVKPALTSLRVSPRSSPSCSPRAPPSAEILRGSGVIVPFPPTALKSTPKPSVTSGKPSPRPAFTAVKSSPRSISPSVKASARPASPSAKSSARLASSTMKATPRPASPSTRATMGTSLRVDPTIVANRSASPSRKSFGASPNQPPSPSPRASEHKSFQVSTLNDSATDLSASSRPRPNIGKPSASTNSVASSLSPATSARSMPSPSSSSLSLLKSKKFSVSPSTRKGAQSPSCESPRSLSTGRSDPNLDVHAGSVDVTAVNSVVQEVPIQRLRIARFKRNGSAKATEIVSLEVHPSNSMALNKKKRCGWITSQSDDVHIAYHDNEWGVPVYDDKLLFELIVLQGAQAELSWPTILARRNNFRAVFANFDPVIVAKFDEKKKLSLIADSSICFPEAKVRGVVDNAAHVLKIIEEHGSLNKFLWSYVNHKPVVSHYKLAKQVPVKTPKAEALSKELLRRGFRFVGPTTMYSVMQAAGLVCDHLVTCYKYQKCPKENSPTTDTKEETPTDSWQRISLPEWRGASTMEPRVGASDAYPQEFTRGSAKSSDPVWGELPNIDRHSTDEELDGMSTSSTCEIPVC